MEDSSLGDRLAAIESRIAEIEHRLGIHRVAQQRVETIAPIVELENQSAEPPAPKPPAPKRDLEAVIGAHWLNRIGILAILVGSAYFLRYAFENEWIGPGGRVAVGVLIGIAILIWSEKLERPTHRLFSYSLKVLAVGVLDLSIWAASQLYELIPNAVASIAMIIVTGTMAALAIRHGAQFIAALALVAGFLTPILLSSGENRPVELFLYLALLDAAALILVALRPWGRLLLLAFFGTLILYIAWYTQDYTAAQSTRTTAFAALFFLLFSVPPLLRKESPPHSRVIVILPFLNAFTFLFQLVAMHDNRWLAGVSIALAVFFGVYASVLRALKRDPTLLAASIILAVGFLTIAIPLRLDSEWLTLGWLIEAGALLLAGRFTRTPVYVQLGGIALTLGLFRLLALTDFSAKVVLFNMRALCFAVAIAIFVAMTRLSRDSIPRWRFAVVMLNALALLAITEEVSDFYGVGAGAGIASKSLARDFTHSAVWMLYGTALMTAGFRWRSSFIRKFAMVLLGVTVAKVFLYDLSALDRGYRIISFIALGVILLAISFAYQRKWLDRPDDASG